MIQRELIDTVEQAPDLEIHTSLLHTDRGTLVDFRQFVPSLERYGRGVTFPVDALRRGAANGLIALVERIERGEEVSRGIGGTQT